MIELAVKAYSYLGRKPVLCMDMLEALRRGEGTVAAVREDGALVYIGRSGAYLLAAENMDVGEALCGGNFRPNQVAVHSLKNAEMLMDRLQLSQIMACRAAAYLEPAAPEPEEGLDFQPMGESHRQQVLEAFPQGFEEAELRERLRAGVMQGAFSEGRLAGVVGLYPEGGVGLLAAESPPVRAALVAHITGWCLQNCFAPFAHIPVEDEELAQVFAQTGYTFSDQAMYWLA